MQYALRLTVPQAPQHEPRAACPPAWREMLPAGDVVALYFGTEFCEDRLPSAAEASAYVAVARTCGCQPALLTPIVSDAGLERVAALLTHLGATAPDAAVVFNDWGVFDLLRTRHPQLERRAGRLMNRSLRDPRVYGHANRPYAVQGGDRFTHLRTFLSDAGVCAIETDADIEGGLFDALPRSPALQRTLHVPFVLAASGRSCPLKAGLHTPGDGFSKVLDAPCPAPCRGAAIPVKRGDVALPLWRAGNTVFYEAPCEAATHWLAHTDRVVVHPEPAP